MKAGLAVIAAALTTACFAMSEAPGPVVQEHHDVDRGAATSARVDISMGAGDLEVKSGAATLLAGDFMFNVPSLKPDIQYSVSGTTGTLKVSQGSANGNYENTWHLSLDDKTPIDLHIAMGAGDAELVLGSLNLRSLEVRLGAGDVKVDLRGTPAQSYKAAIQTGAGDTRVELPANVGISASTSGLIGDASVDGLEKRDGKWINPKAAGSPVTIDLSVQHAIGDLRISAQ